MDVSSMLDVWDYVSLTAVIGISTIAGVYQIYTARKETNPSKFLVHTPVGVLPLILSHVATHLSAISLLGFPAEIYRNGLTFVIQALSVVISAPFAVFLFVPVLFKLNKASVFEYLELRFGKPIRTCMSIAFITQEVLICGIVIYAPSLALNQVIGIHLWTSAITIVAAAVIYTSLGGIKAVIWADAGQCVVMISVYLLIIIKGIIDVGGANVVWDRLKEGDRSQIFIWSSNPHSQYSFWTLAIGLSIQYTWINSFNQSFVQRYQSNKTLIKAQLTLFGGAVGAALFYILLGIGGAVMYAYYYNCDPLLSGKIKQGDQATVLFAVQVLSFCKGMSGLFIGAIMCATLSTVSSMINSVTIITLKDVVTLIKPNLSEQSTKTLSRTFVAFYGLLALGTALLAENLGGILIATISIDGITGGACFAVFTTGMLLPWVHSKGVLIGYVISLILPLWAFIGGKLTALSSSQAPISIDGCSNWTIGLNTSTTSSNFNVTTPTTESSLLHQFYGTSAMWYTSWCVVVGVTVSVIASKLIGFQDPNKVNSDLIFPFVKHFIHKQNQQSAIAKEVQTDNLTADANCPLMNNKEEHQIKD
ncbi:Sodium-coupled monocarboxylate transporter 1 [Chamberlinius hualienensis]